jgi:hypothetical protein
LAACIQNTKPDPIELYNGLSFGGSQPDLAFVKFAKCLLHVSANSASCKRLFSIYGTTLTKLQNWMSDGILKSLAELKMLVCNKHRQSELMKTRLKQQFGLQEPVKDEPLVSADLSNGAAISFSLLDLLLNCLLLLCFCASRN